MGGDAAKERRRLKRLAALEGADGATPTSASDAKSKTPNQEKKVDGEQQPKTANDDVRVRLQRKMARQASGKFKAQTENSPPKPTKPDYNKRKSYDDTDGSGSANNARINRQTPHNYNNAKRSPNNNQSPRHHNNNNTTGKVRNNNRGNNGTNNKKPSANKKNQNAKYPPKAKAKKPKHLKRKMDQLSNTIAEGSNIEDLEGQMKKLAEQMEEFKRLKQKKDAAEKSKTKTAEEEDVTEMAKGKGDEAQEEGNEEEGGESGNKENTEDSGSESSSSDGEDAKAKDVKLTKSVAKEEAKETSSSSSSSSKSSDSDSSSDEEDMEDPTTNARSRGKRRRGRTDNNPETKTDSSTSEEKDDTKSEASTDKPGDPTKKTSKKDDKRRCIGRKPVTSYTIGNTYSGTVKYIKPKLGAFIDIGSHADAFCHISFTSNDYVSSVSDVLKAGDSVENVRIIEINREKKRITVSLRSGDMAENEKERLKSTRQFENAKYAGRSGGGGGMMRHNGHAKFAGHARVGDSRGRSDAAADGGVVQRDEWNQHTATTSPATHGDNSGADLKRERKLARRAQRRANNEQSANAPADGGMAQQDEWNQSTAKSPATWGGDKSGADLKRERKIARRAERRAASEVAN